MFSLALGCAINELCAGADYQEEEPNVEHQAFLEDPHREARPCDAALAMPLKLAQSALTLCLICMIVARFKMNLRKAAAEQRLKDRHLSSFKLARPKDASVRDVLALLAEIIVCSVHIMPFYQADWSIEAMGRQLFYRSESVPCGVMFVR